MSQSLQLYHRLPYPLRVVAASARGYSLSRWRYGPHTQDWVQEALDRESWSPDRWKSWQEERLAYLLHRAATRVPYYREQWAARRRNHDAAGWEYLENWPVLTKEPLRMNPRAFVAEDCDARRMYADHTSGTTGKPLTIWLSKETVQRWYALFEARARVWNGVDRRDRWAILGGQSVTPYRQNRPPYWVWNQGLRQLYLSNYHLGPASAADYLEAISRHQVKYLLGYTSSIYGLASFALEQGLQPPKLTVVLNNAEQIFPHQRQVVGQAFQCPVRDTYGLVELACAASECSHGRLHLWPEVGYLEVLDLESDDRLPPGISGRLVGTGLLNADMPLIRYEIGDQGVLSADRDPCSCGRNLPILHSLEGRLVDLIWMPDGRRIRVTVGAIFSGTHIREGQLIQETLEQVKVRYVPSPDFPAEENQILKQRMQERLPGMEIVLEAVSHIPRSPNGKFQSIISRVAISPRSG